MECPLKEVNMKTYKGIKTRFHWKNITKAFGLVLLAGVIVGFLRLPSPWGFLVGIIAGAAAMILSVNIWELWHFEDISV